MRPPCVRLAQARGGLRDVVGVEIEAEAAAPGLLRGEHGRAEAAEGVEDELMICRLEACAPRLLGRQEALDQSLWKLGREERGVLEFQLFFGLAEIVPQADGVARPGAAVEGVRALTRHRLALQHGPGRARARKILPLRHVRSRPAGREAASEQFLRLCDPSL